MPRSSACSARSASLPYIVLSVPAGVIADRFDRRLVLLSSDLVRGSVMVLMTLIVATDGPVLALVLLAMVAASGSAFFYPAMAAYLPSLAADERQLGPANSAMASIGNLSFIVGPAIGGLLIATGGLVFPFILNALSFLVIAGILWTLPPSIGRAARRAPAEEAVTARRGPPRATAARPRRIQRPPSAEPLPAPVAGVRPAADAPKARLPWRPFSGVLLIQFIEGFFDGGIQSATIIIAVSVLNAGEEANGFLNAAIGVGGLIGALVSSVLVLRRRLSGPLIAGAAITAVGAAILGCTPLLSVALLAIGLTAAGSIVIDVVLETVFQRVVPDELRGRAFGTMMTLSTVSAAAGAFLIPILIVNIGAFQTLGLSGAAILVGSIVALGLLGGAMTRRASPFEETVARVARLPLFAGVAAIPPRGRTRSGPTRGGGARPGDRSPGRAGRPLLHHRVRVAHRQPGGRARRIAHPAAARAGRGLRRAGPAQPGAAIGDGHGGRGRDAARDGRRRLPRAGRGERRRPRQAAEPVRGVEHAREAADRRLIRALSARAARHCSAMAQPLDPYRTLGLAPGASQDEIRRAYRRLAKANHPDSAGEAALPRFLAIQAAYEMLEILADDPPRTGPPAPGPAVGRGSRPGSGDPRRLRPAARRAVPPPPALPRALHRRAGRRAAARVRRGHGGRRGQRRCRRHRPDRRGSAGSSRRKAGRTGRKKATLGSTSYDAAEDEPFEPDWSGSTWYGASSGTYWTINPKEYADPRKHGPEYQRRARRVIDGLEDDPANEDATFAGDDLGGQESESAAGAQRRTGFDGRWTYPDDAVPDPAGTAEANAAHAAPPPPPPVDAGPGLSTADNVDRLLRGDVGLTGRLGLAFLAWVPFGIAISWLSGEMSGCSRFTAGCVDSAGIWTALIQFAVIALFVLLPSLAAISAAGTLAGMAVALVAAFVLSAGGGSRQPDAADGRARRRADRRLRRRRGVRGGPETGLAPRTMRA